VPRVSRRPEYRTDEIVELIRQYIHNKTDRKMLYLRLVDGDTIGEIATATGLDEKTVWRRLHKGERELFSHLPG